MDTQSSPESTILVVDDTAANLDLLSSLLKRRGYKVRSAISGKIAIRAARKSPPDLILLDVMMPEMDGFAVCRELKNDDFTSDIPVIFISALGEVSSKIKAFEMGGVDYITKPFRSNEVLARVETHLTLSRQQRQIKTLARIKDHMMRAVSNNLKNPLSLIIGYTDLLNEGRVIETSPEQAQKLVERIDAAAKQMNGLVLSLLEFGKLEQDGQLAQESTHINHLLRSCITNVRRRATEKNITITFEPQTDETFEAVVDPVRIGQVMSSLLANSIDYTLTDGHIRVETSIADQSELQIRVIDDGIGIPKAETEAVFQEFYRVKSDSHLVTEGTGLGLSIARAIIRQHRGQIWAESDLGEGCTMHISLPIRS